ncbi:ribosome small subunit-dependent GTPase A [Micrococcales bacterium 31B]|nr:ribosome small subunit-dependent GTPase A [Micrococcales bacterium 31B]
MSSQRWDESSVRIRPNRKGNKPRTKDRPQHADAAHGMVIAVDRGRYKVLLGTVPESFDSVPRTDEKVLVNAMRARELARASIVPGDVVAVTGDVSGRVDTLARIVRIEPRRTVLRRSADDSDPVERVIVANADQMVIVTALANPAPRPRMIDRCLVAAFDAGMEAVLCLTKSDLAAADDFVQAYRHIDVRIVVTSRGVDDSDILGVEEVLRELRGKVSVLIGHSGVGKSTLVNALVPDADRATGRVNDVTGRGRHTSTSARALPLPGEDGWVVDTPGVRSFGLAHVDPDRILTAFDDLYEIAEDCPRGCTHEASAPDCELDVAIGDGDADEGLRARRESFRRIAEARTATSSAGFEN